VTAKAFAARRGFIHTAVAGAVGLTLAARSTRLSAAVLLAACAVARAQTFELDSADLPDGVPIAQPFVYRGFGCTGGNRSPQLAWKNAPAATQSFALFVHDPDAPTGGAGFWHWAVIDLPASVSGLTRGAGAAGGKALPPAARQLANDFGTPGWGGPCPPAGDKPHRYVFTLYALDVARLDVASNASAARASVAASDHALAKASLTRRYGR